ncbi:HXXXD-type acyl-transferase family protein [Raphanus sativus]|uniref:BAHD acyltransferase At5g47980-like n=1 Tax=Raphanus sativus TaxID=3726 RepID=A0A9W3CKQ1_RAPSA|nr:BAHD acyltransferase At5g47980-like [Raphanus sativus]KAJ4873486.1 HXXXD-type acyl-transferase family protein [Raphanus sativus]
MAMKLEILSKEVIKPDSPNHLQTLHLSLFDQFLPTTYVSAIFFYDDHQPDQEEILVQKLKNSLSQTLSLFYPLAGRIKEGVTVDCNDEGALFTKARADVLLSDVLRNPSDAGLVHKLIVSPDRADPGTWPLLHVKVVFFRDRGFAVAVSASHKLCDAASLSMFVRSWTKAAKGFADTVNPEFSASVFFPPADISVEFPPFLEPKKKSKTKSFVFGPLMIEKLKIRASCGLLVPQATRGESITALLLRCMTNSRRPKTEAVTEFAITHTMNLRPRVPLSFLPRKAIRNFFFLPLLKETSENKMEIQETVSKLRKTKEELNELITKDSEDSDTNSDEAAKERIVSAMLSFLCEVSPEAETYAVSSWCRMSFYDADFGWGFPVWVAPGSVDKTQVVLMDAKDGEGVEAWVTLPETDMAEFEHDDELLVYAPPS